MFGLGRAAVKKSMLVDIHTHVYTPRLVSLLRSRSVNPRIHTPIRDGPELLSILPSEVSGGRPVGPQYWSRSSKLAFMDRHRIDLSVVSLANPWLDWMEPQEAIIAAAEVNEDLARFCVGETPDASGDKSLPSTVFSAGDARSNYQPCLSDGERLRAFGILPLANDVPVSEIVKTLHEISQSPYLCGAIIGTRGLGKGLDDPALEPLWEAAASLQQTLFLHPHYGVGAQAVEPDGLWGPQPNGHVLPLALGFPYETAASTARLILSGVFDRHPDLRILLAHSGGALPVLSSRLASCVAHDPAVHRRLAHDPRYYLGKLYYDAVAYGPEELEFVAKVVGRAARYKRGGSGADATPKAGSVESAQEIEEAVSRFAFGTDHPFFPPPASEVSESSAEQQPWRSVLENLSAINQVPSWTEAHRRNVMSGNALSILGITVNAI